MWAECEDGKPIKHKGAETKCKEGFNVEGAFGT